MSLVANILMHPGREASREATNLTERKNPHTPVYGVKDFWKEIITLIHRGV